jgi:hypothetical protein
MQTEGIPNEVRALLVQSAETAASLARLLPETAPASWGKIAYRDILSAVLHDWSENGTPELEEEDVRNLTSFVHLASDIASRSDLPDQDVTFEVVLKALLDDWVENWLGDVEEEGEVEDEEDLDDI